MPTANSIKAELHSPAWFDETFVNVRPVPPQLRKMSERMCRTYHIRGVCDPMYIANVAAFELGVGTGSGTFFTNAALRPSLVAIKALARRLGFAYSTCIANKMDTLESLLAEELDCCEQVST